MLSKFIETELNALIQDQRLTESPLMVKLICKAFEAYDEYRRLVSPSCKCNNVYNTLFMDTAGLPLGKNEQDL